MDMSLHGSLKTTADFERCYTEYYPMLCMIAYEYTRDKVLAEEMVGDTFLALWEKRELLEITTSVKNYLIKSTQNTCLQYIRKKKVQTRHIADETEWEHIPWSDNYPLGQLFEKELSDKIAKAIEALPPKCREVFLLSRIDEMSYSQIAEALQISENTVKTQLKTALSRIRNTLSDYFPIILVLLADRWL